MSKITRKTYHIERKETVVYTFAVDAKTKKEALQLVDDHEVGYDGMYGVNTYKAKVSHIETFDECPNKGRAFSDLPVEIVAFNEDEKPYLTENRKGTTWWHYNGYCKGEKNTKDSVCGFCQGCMNKGMRFTTSAENRHLNKQYNLGLIVGTSARMDVIE